jgi:hypothetical protein
MALNLRFVCVPQTGPPARLWRLRAIAVSLWCSFLALRLSASFSAFLVATGPRTQV